MSWIAQSGGNHAERGVAEKSIGIGESWRVEGIEELASDLQLHALSHQERFGESNINILNAIGAQIGEVASSEAHCRAADRQDPRNNSG